LLHIFIDADACPVKKEVYRVAVRYRLSVTVVSNSRMRVPDESWISQKVVGAALDAADDWIVENVQADDIVVTADIPLAGRCIGKRARVIGSTGKPFTEDNIGDSVATRDLLAELREAGEITGGPPPLTNKDRARFLQKLDEMIQSIRRNPAGMDRARTCEVDTPGTPGGQMDQPIPRLRDYHLNFAYRCD
jgi:uncharacterized protein YaiI (UPF0178 family)